MPLGYGSNVARPLNSTTPLDLSIFRVCHTTRSLAIDLEPGSKTWLLNQARYQIDQAQLDAWQSITVSHTAQGNLRVAF